MRPSGTHGTTTTQFEGATSTTLARIVGGVATRLDSGCSYERRAVFGLHSEVTSTVVDGTEYRDKGSRLTASW